jgi:hypothetical protein
MATSRSSSAFRIRLPVWARPSHPVFHQETQRHAVSKGLAVLQLIFLPILFAVASLSLFGALTLTLPLLVDATADSVVLGVLSVSLSILMTIQFGAGALANVMVITQVSPVISGEMELQSWRLLRTTTLPLHEIVFAKFSAALLHLRLMLGGLMILRIITAVSAVLLFLYTILRQDIYSRGITDYFLGFEWIPQIFAMGVVLVAYLYQPVIQYFLNGSLGLVASAYTRSRGQSIAGALMLRLAVWAFAFLIHVAAITSLSSMIDAWAHPSSAPYQSFHLLPTPSTQAVTWVTFLVIAGYAIAVVAGQIGLSMLTTGIALRRSRELGE